MHCSYAMTSPKDTTPEEEGADADGAERDGAEREEGVAKLTAKTETRPHYV